ncbi:hypothetical protein E8E11_000354 [Didymella keratinophila]|nr:hypothetical protein E8E11_000354 [Didymella keratinophila]
MPLVRFAQTSKYARSLAYSNVQNLSLAIYPSHRSSWHNKLFAARHKPKHNLNAAIQIPRAWEFDYSTLIKFHDKVVASILTRHACALQKLDLTVWRMSKPIAKAIGQLPALRKLCVSIESLQAIPRACMTMQRKEECAAWSQLASNPAFMGSVNTLMIKNAEINTTQLSDLVNEAERLKDLRLSSCNMLTSEFWSSTRLRSLHHLSLTDCVNVHVNEASVDTISKMNRLQVLDLHGCSGLDGEVLEQWNRDVWRVPVFVAPSPKGALKEETIIEVDPDYMFEAED